MSGSQAGELCEEAGLPRKSVERNWLHGDWSLEDVAPTATGRDDSGACLAAPSAALSAGTTTPEQRSRVCLFIVYDRVLSVELQ